MNKNKYNKQSFFNKCKQKATMGKMKEYNNKFFEVVDELQNNETITKEQKESLLYAKELLKQVNRKI